MLPIPTPSIVNTHRNIRVAVSTSWPILLCILLVTLTSPHFAFAPPKAVTDVQEKQETRSKHTEKKIRFLIVGEDHGDQSLRHEITSNSDIRKGSVVLYEQAIGYEDPMVGDVILDE